MCELRVSPGCSRRVCPERSVDPGNSASYIELCPLRFNVYIFPSSDKISDDCVVLTAGALALGRLWGSSTRLRLLGAPEVPYEIVVPTCFPERTLYPDEGYLGELRICEQEVDRT